MHYQFGSSPKPTDNICECVKNNGGKFVLLGEPGSGKSVALLKIAIAYAEKAMEDSSALIPVLVPLGSYTGNETIDSFTLGFLGELGKQIDVNNRVIKIFDALNETVSDKTDTVISYIKGSRFVVSCRILDYEESFSGIKGVSTIEILPLDPVRIRDAVSSELWEQLGGNKHIISAWKKITDSISSGEDLFWHHNSETADSSEESEKAKEYRRMLEKIDLSPNETIAYKQMIDKGIMPLCRNPLMLSIAFGLYSHSTLPDTRGKLIKEFVKKSINDELNRRKITDVQVAPRISDVLKTAARSIQEQRIGTDTLIISDLIKVYGNEKDEVLFAVGIARDAGVLAINHSEKHNIKFYHQLFQEYYASIALQDIVKETYESNEVFLFNKEKWWESNGWEETVVLLAETTSKNDFDKLLLWLAKFQPLLTVRCIESSRDFIPKTNTKEEIRSMWLSRINNEVLSTKNRISIAKIGDALSKIGDNRIGIGKKYLLPDIDWREINCDKLYVSRNLISVEQYNAFIEDNGYDYTTGVWEIPDFDVNYDFKIEKSMDRLNTPIVGVTWFEACAFCNWLSRKIGEKVRLPTSDEWSKIFFKRFPENVYENESDIFNVAVDGVELRLTANGIYSLSKSTIAEDLIGNAWEWCNDILVDNEDYDPIIDEPPVTMRIMKGGSWRYRKDYATPSFSLYSFPFCKRSDVGFRIVKEKNK